MVAMFLVVVNQPSGASVWRGARVIWWGFVPAWDYAQEGGRTGAGRVIVEGFIDFDYEIKQGAQHNIAWRSIA